MRHLLPILVAVLLLGSSAQAASLPVLRTDLSGAQGKAQGLSDEHRTLTSSLDTVARRIEALKSERAARGGVFSDAELDALLKESQELSGRLSELSRREAQAADGLREVQARLVTQLDQELASLRSQWDSSANRSERAALVPRMKALRAERDVLRRAMPAALVPRVTELATDDADDLLERADALLDSEDKLRREEKVLTARIAELSSERDLERRMSEFLSEESLFDEHDRRLSVSRPARADAAKTTGGPQSDSAVPPTAPQQAGAPEKPSSADRIPGPTLQPPPARFGAANDTTGTPASFTKTESASPAGSATPTPRTAASPSHHDGLEQAPDDGARAGSLKMPPERRAGASAWSEDESVEELTARQAQLRSLADELHRKAGETAKRARGAK